MLNRKVSNYLFIASLVVIVVLVFVIRLVLVGNLTDRIESIDSSNISLQSQIEDLEEIVQDNKEQQVSHVYDLYNTIPNIYSEDQLEYMTVSLLERLDITERVVDQRKVKINPTTSFSRESIFYELSLEYYIVEVDVFFSTSDDSKVLNFIDELYISEQLFIIRDIVYNVPDGNDYIGVAISFLAFYNVDIETE